MIKVTRSSVTDDEVELIITAAQFFLDRLLTAAELKKLTMNIDVTNKPGRKPIAIKWMVGSNGFFGWKPPRHFVMTVSVAAGVKDGLEVAANEIVHVAQTVSGRLKISLKTRKVNGKREDAYAASWVNGKFAFVDMTPRDNRLWEAEAHHLKTQLVEEFLAWSVGKLKKLPIQKPKRNGYGLYAVSPQRIAARVTIPNRPASALEEIYQLNDVVDLPAHRTDLIADAPVVDELKDGQFVIDQQSPTPEQESPATTPSAKTLPPKKSNLPLDEQMPDQRILLNHLGIDSDEFKIAVNVPLLGMDRLLDSTMLHDKLNDLLERGLIPHTMASTAFQQAKQNRADK